MFGGKAGTGLKLGEYVGRGGATRVDGTAGLLAPPSDVHPGVGPHPVASSMATAGGWDGELSGGRVKRGGAPTASATPGGGSGPGPAACGGAAGGTPFDELLPRPFGSGPGPRGKDFLGPDAVRTTVDPLTGVGASFGVVG